MGTFTIAHTQYDRSVDNAGPAISTLSVEDQSGSDYPVTIAFLDANPPITLYLMASLQSQGDATERQIMLGLSPLGFPAAFATSFVATQDSLGDFDLNGLTSGQYRLQVIAVSQEGKVGLAKTADFTIA